MHILLLVYHVFVITESKNMKIKQMGDRRVTLILISNNNEYAYMNYPKTKESSVFDTIF